MEPLRTTIKLIEINSLSQLSIKMPNLEYPMNIESSQRWVLHKVKGQKSQFLIDLINWSWTLHLCRPPLLVLFFFSTYIIFVLVIWSFSRHFWSTRRRAFGVGDQLLETAAAWRRVSKQMTRVMAVVGAPDGLSGEQGSRC